MRRIPKDDLAALPKNAVAMLGGAVLLIIAAALVLLTVFCIKGASGGADKHPEETERLERLIAPLVMCDVAPFDSASELPDETLAKICVWAALDVYSDELSAGEDGRLALPGSTVSGVCESLFGGETSPMLMSFSDGGVYFEYDAVRDTYYIPITGIEGGYVPSITDIRVSGSVKTLTVDYYTEDYGSGTQKVKTMTYILRGESGAETVAGVAAG